MRKRKPYKNILRSHDPRGSAQVTLSVNRWFSQNFLSPVLQMNSLNSVSSSEDIKPPPGLAGMGGVNSYSCGSPGSLSKHICAICGDRSSGKCPHKYTCTRARFIMPILCLDVSYCLKMRILSSLANPYVIATLITFILPWNTNSDVRNGQLQSPFIFSILESVLFLFSGSWKKITRVWNNITTIFGCTLFYFITRPLLRY